MTLGFFSEYDEYSKNRTFCVRTCRMINYMPCPMAYDSVQMAYDSGQVAYDGVCLPRSWIHYIAHNCYTSYVHLDPNLQSTNKRRFLRPFVPYDLTTWAVVFFCCEHESIIKLCC